ncbi:MAG: MarR family winged helix-turn-helix transcriptional regulator [Bryobacteraceae bacterium]|jgi:DNA-binding MarR family transcriptional regulator
MESRFPLPTLLSCALVAFTIEFDNESEHRMPHRTTSHGATAGSLHTPWLVSLAMSSNCMQFVGEDGVTIGELQRLARTPTNLDGMQRWGYIVVEPGPAGSRAKPPRSEWVIRATPAGRKAQEIWRPLFGVIEKRWQARFGEDQIGRLREALWAVASQIEVELPDCLPILGYGLFSNKVQRSERRAPAGRGRDSASSLSLAALFSKVLLAFAIEFERESEVSLAIGANVLRLAGEGGVRVRDLPRIAAVSKEAIAMAVGFLGKRGYASVEPESTGSGVKVLRLTDKGRHARETYHQLVRSIEDRWRARFGMDAVGGLRELLEHLVGEPTAEHSPLFRGLEPYPDGWRAAVPRAAGLPHYPMILHRGGFPDGS